MFIILQVNEIIIDHLHSRIAVLFRINPKGSCGPMDKAPVYGTGDSGFEPRQDLLNFGFFNSSFFCITHRDHHLYDVRNLSTNFQVDRSSFEAVVVASIEHGACH